MVKGRALVGRLGAPSPREASRPGPGSALFPRRPGVGRGHRFSSLHSSFSSCGPASLARTRACWGTVRERKLHLHSGSQIQERKPNQGVATLDKIHRPLPLGSSRPAFCSPRSARCDPRGDEGGGNRRPRRLPTALQGLPRPVRLRRLAPSHPSREGCPGPKATWAGGRRETAPRRSGAGVRRRRGPRS